MNENQENTRFEYTYSAKEQEELRKIRSKYAPKPENKLDQLRRLDAQVNQKASICAISAGICGALILGTGMSCCMVWSGAAFVPGVIIGVIGIAVIAAAYPFYNRILKRERARIAPEILRLTEELMK